MAATTEAMRDALTGALYSQFKATALAINHAQIAAAVELALETTGYDAMADYVAQAEALIPLYQAEVPSPPSSIAAALVEVDTARTTVRTSSINSSLVNED